MGIDMKNSGNFLDDLEVALLMLGRDGDDIRLILFPLLVKEEAKVWYQGLEIAQRGTWEALRGTFLRRCSRGENPKELWQKLSMLQQSSLKTYSGYEANSLKMWAQWIADFSEGEKVPKFLQEEKFMARLFPLL